MRSMMTMTTTRSPVASSARAAAAPAAVAARRSALVSAAPLRRDLRSRSSSILPPPRALDLDWSDPDTIIGALGGVLGIVVGIGAPLFYISRDKKDEGETERRRGRIEIEGKAIELVEAWRACRGNASV